MAVRKETIASTRIFVGLVVGVILGLLLNRFVDAESKAWIIRNITGPLGTGFLRSLFMVVIPLVLSTLITGVASLQSGGSLKRVGGRVMAFYLMTTLVAVIIGQILVLTIEPGAGIDPQLVEQSKVALADQTKSLQERSEAVGSSLWPGLVDTVIPRNIVDEFAKSNMLAIIFVALIFGIALLQLPSERRDPVISFFSGISEATILIIGWIMRFVAPFAVAALVINAVAVYDFHILGNVLKFAGVVVCGLLAQFLITYPLIIKFLIRKIPLKEFYVRFAPVIATAFGTSSSNATLPTNMRVLQDRFGVPSKITSFTLPIGATVNMDGTALFEIVTAIFIAQVFHVDLSLTAHLSLVVIMVVTSIGVAGVPGGSIPILMSAMAFVGIPPEGIALVLGIDRLLDMSRTVINVTGDAVGTLWVAGREGVDYNKELTER